MNFDKTYWNQRYIDNETGWDVGEIATPLKEYFDQLNDKSLKIIIPGCGNAYEAEYLFNKGFHNVFLVDISPIALKQFSDRLPQFPQHQLVCDDFFNHNKQYDLMVEQTFFCALNPNLRNKYAEHTANLLNPKGKLIGLLFNDTLYTEHPPFGGSKEEYINYFTPYFNIDVMETAYNSIKPRKDRELFINLTKK